MIIRNLSSTEIILSTEKSCKALIFERKYKIKEATNWFPTKNTSRKSSLSLYPKNNAIANAVTPYTAPRIKRIPTIFERDFVNKPLCLDIFLLL